MTTETDYLVIGAGASALALVDELLTHSDAEIVMVDRRHAPGGHWVDAYPFVRLHQPSAYYGVNSRPLGHDQLVRGGDDDGFYERATGPEVQAYYLQVLRDFEGTGRVRFLPSTEYRGSANGVHRLVSLRTGRETTVTVRRRLVDATQVQSEVPARGRPSYDVAEGVTLVTPNELALGGAAGSRFTVIGAGKTGMDTCDFLLGQGVDADAIRWIRPRDGWFVDRTYTQPFEQSGSLIGYQARLVEGCATADDGHALALHLESHGMMHRIDPQRRPEVFRGAVISRNELQRLRSIENVVSGQRVIGLGGSTVELEQDALDVLPGEVFVDCTAQGLATPTLRSVFDGDVLNVQFTTLGVAPWSAATIGFVETLDVDDDEKNRLCPPVPRTGLIADYLQVLEVGFRAETTRRDDPRVAAWAATARLNPGRSIPETMGEPDVQASLHLLLGSIEPATANLQRVIA